MYEYNVGIIAEGPTDVEVIEGILRTAFAKDTFCFFLLGQPKSEKERRLIRQKEGKMKKNTKGYQNLARRMTATSWMSVTQRYIQAKRFDTVLKEEMRRVRR